MADAQPLLDWRKPLDDLEAEVVRHQLANPAPVEEADRLRAVVSLARTIWVRNPDGQDFDVRPHTEAFRSKVISRLGHRLEDGLGPAFSVLPELEKDAHKAVHHLIHDGSVEREALIEEARLKNLVVVLGGGGGSGYGYNGALGLLNREGLEPKLVAGTSIGAMMAAFRARSRFFDEAPLHLVSKNMKWNRTFRMLDTNNRYGLPATLRLYLRSIIGDAFVHSDGTPMIIDDLEIPLLVCATGVTVDALKHDLEYYEHFLDGFVKPGRMLRIGRVGNLVSILRELVAERDALREIVFGADEITRSADVVDAVGFSSSVPGLIHYDIHRDDPRMKTLLDQLYAEHGITRLIEGGVVNNVPVRPAFTEIMEGRLIRRGCFILALDCFAPRKRDHIFYPIQQIVRSNVTDNIPFAHHYHIMERRLSPTQLLPEIEKVVQAAEWTADELRPTIPFIQQMCRPIPGEVVAALLK